MTIDEIIKLAQEAGFQIETDWVGRPSLLVIKDGGVFLRGAHEIVRFATLIHNAVLEEAARVCTDLDDEALAKEGRLACGSECAAAIRVMKENCND